mgnify:CR=1 FL=1|jgi:hypothetical protein
MSFLFESFGNQCVKPDPRSSLRGLRIQKNVRLNNQRNSSGSRSVWITNNEISCVCVVPSSLTFMIGYMYVLAKAGLVEILALTAALVSAGGCSPTAPTSGPAGTGAPVPG